MSIIGIESLTYAVKELGESARFFQDFGLELTERDDDLAAFELPDGSRIILRPLGHAGLPSGSRINGSGVHEITWGVDTQASLDALAAAVEGEAAVEREADGSVRFVPPFGLPMRLRLFTRRPIVCAPDPVNAPGHVRRLNQHRRWRRRAIPKAIGHVVFAAPQIESVGRFMTERLNFRLSDLQKGFGAYYRADGTLGHHSFALANASAPLPDMDGTLRFHHANFVVEDIDEIMAGANWMARRGWEPSKFGLGRHRVDSALFYYLDCPGGGEAEYGADSDCVDDGWVPREFDPPLFGYANFVHNLPPFLREEPEWGFRYLDPFETAEVRP